MSEKFKFVDEEETNKKSVEDNIEIKPIPEKISVEKKEEETGPVKEIKPDITKRFYFSFEARIVVSIIIALLLFVGACFLGYKVINHTTVQRIRYVEHAFITNQTTLNKDICIPDDYTYNASDIKKIKLIFEYVSKYDKKIKHKNYYKIISVISKYNKDDHSLVSEKETNLIEKRQITGNGEDYNIMEVFNIDYAKYKKLYDDADDLDTQLEIKLYVIENGETREISAITIPLSKDSFQIKRFEKVNVIKDTYDKVNIWDTYALIYGLSASILVLISLILIYKTTRLVLKVTNNSSEYEDAVEAILKENDSIISVAGEGFESIVPEEKEVVKLESFEELTKIREEVNKQIIYSKINNVKCEFLLESDDKLYKYVMKEVDFTEEDKNKLENK